MVSFAHVSFISANSEHAIASRRKMAVIFEVVVAIFLFMLLQGIDYVCNVFYVLLSIVIACSYNR